MSTIADIIAQINFSADGFIPVIAQEESDGTVLTLAWMNAEALEKTLTTGELYYWSRSRGKLWRKGETSGQTQELQTLILDCDHDALLAKVTQTGVACHTGRHSCFFHTLDKNGITVNQPVEVDPETLYGKK